MTTSIGSGAGATVECAFCLSPMDQPQHAGVIARIQDAPDKQRELTKVVQESLQNARTLTEDALLPLHGTTTDTSGRVREITPHIVHFRCYADQIRADRRNGTMGATTCLTCRAPLGDLHVRVFTAVTSPPRAAPAATTPPPPLAKRIALAVAGVFELFLAVPLFLAFGLAGMSMPAVACLDLMGQGVRMITRGDSRLQWNMVNKVFNGAGVENSVAGKVLLAAFGCLPVPVSSPFIFWLWYLGSR